MEGDFEFNRSIPEREAEGLRVLFRDLPVEYQIDIPLRVVGQKRSMRDLVTFSVTRGEPSNSYVVSPKLDRILFFRPVGQEITVNQIYAEGFFTLLYRENNIQLNHYSQTL